MAAIGALGSAVQGLLTAQAGAEEAAASIPTRFTDTPAREGSLVGDVADLISEEAAFRANAATVASVDEMLSELIDLTA
ncbi:MAG: hypothetical protein ACFB22_12485 [Rhodothalassiaceae bacterium]